MTQTTTTNKALIIVDLQNDFVTGTLPVPGAEEAARKISTLCEVAKAANQYVVEGLSMPYTYIVATQDWHIEPGDHFTTWPEHCRAHTEGAALATELPGLYTTFHKGMYGDGYSGMEAEENEYGGTLAHWLHGMGVTEVDIVGLALDHCVKATALDAVKEGFKATVHVPFTAAVTPEGAAQAIAEMREAGVEVEE